MNTISARLLLPVSIICNLFGLGDVYSYACIYTISTHLDYVKTMSHIRYLAVVDVCFDISSKTLIFQFCFVTKFE